VRLALLAEGMSLTMAYPAIHTLGLFADPEGFVPRVRGRDGMQDFARLDMPVSTRLADETLWFTTSVLMGSSDDARDVVEAVAKVQSLAHTLPTDDTG
jgi:hypothetical protein